MRIRFDLEEEQLAFAREYVTEDEIELQKEEVSERTQDEIIEISDDEEGPSQYNSKRQRSVLSDDEPEDEPSEEPGEEPSDEPDLPEQNTQRVSGRVRKLSRLLDGYEA